MEILKYVFGYMYNWNVEDNDVSISDLLFSTLSYSRNVDFQGTNYQDGVHDIM